MNTVFIRRQNNTTHNEYCLYRCSSDACAGDKGVRFDTQAEAEKAGWTFVFESFFHKTVLCPQCNKAAKPIKRKSKIKKSKKRIKKLKMAKKVKRQKKFIEKICNTTCPDDVNCFSNVVNCIKCWKKYLKEGRSK